MAGPNVSGTCLKPNVPQSNARRAHMDRRAPGPAAPTRTFAALAALLAAGLTLPASPAPARSGPARSGLVQLRSAARPGRVPAGQAPCRGDGDQDGRSSGPGPGAAGVPHAHADDQGLQPGGDARHRGPGAVVQRGRHHADQRAGRGGRLPRRRGQVQRPGRPLLRGRRVRRFWPYARITFRDPAAVQRHREPDGDDPGHRGGQQGHDGDAAARDGPGHRRLAAAHRQVAAPRSCWSFTSPVPRYGSARPAPGRRWARCGWR